MEKDREHNFQGWKPHPFTQCLCCGWGTAPTTNKIIVVSCDPECPSNAAPDASPPRHLPQDLLPCFNSSLHRSDYLKPCELATEQLANETAEWARLGFTALGNDPPRCDIGGFFDKVQVSR